MATLIRGIDYAEGVRPNTKQDFLDRIEDAPDGCRYLNNRKGDRSSFWYQNRQWTAARVAWLFYQDEDPGEWQICHHCDHPACVHEDHLFKGTCQDNMTDKVNKGRQSIGETHGMAKLSDLQVQEIKKRYTRGVTRQADLATEYGVSQITISRIVRGVGRVWRL